MDGKPGMSQIEADPDGLTIDPKIAKDVEKYFIEKHAMFAVKQRKYDGSLMDRWIELTEKEIIVRTSPQSAEQDKFKLKVKYHPNLFVNLSPWESNVFDIEFNDPSRNRPVFVCQDIRERDVIALTIRSFNTVATKNTGQVPLHRISQLNEIRSEDRLKYHDSSFKQAMLSV